MKAWETLSPAMRSQTDFYEKQEDLMKFCEQRGGLILKLWGVESRDAHAAIGTKIEALEMDLRREWICLRIRCGGLKRRLIILFWCKDIKAMDVVEESIYLIRLLLSI